MNQLFSYLEKNDIFIDETEFEFQSQTHPDYPSLLSISDTLSFLKIKNLATRVKNEDLIHLPVNFIAFIQDKKLESNLTFVEKTKIGYKYLENDVVVEKNEVEFLEAFQNIVLLAEKEENEIDETKNSNNPLLLVSILLGLFYLTLVFINGFSLLVVLFICLASVGIYLSYEAISSEFGIKTKFSEAVCSITTNADCNAVLNAVKSKIIEKIGFSTVSITFFCTQIVGILLFSVFNKPIVFFNITSTLLILSIPVIVFSIYHQTVVTKKWCPICMAIIFVILLELTTLIVGGKFQFVYIPIYSLSYVFLLIGIYSAVYLIKNSYKVSLDRKSTIAQNNRFKRNYSLFKMALNASEKLETTSYDSEKIILGNPNSNLKILIVSSPFCGYCKNADELVSEILDRYNDKVCIQFHFNLNIALNEDKAKELHLKLLQIYYEFGQNKFLKNLSNWFNTKDFNKIDNVNGLEENESKLIKILENQYNLNLQNKLTFTPAIIINDFHFPKQYERSDLIYFIEELADDESFN
jgi:thiol-disulfide isomerase/thioredoxin